MKRLLHKIGAVAALLAGLLLVGYLVYLLKVL